jgi:hypothetical protein
MNILLGNKGASRFAVFFWLLLLFIAVHIAVKLVPMYMDYWRMDDEIRAKIGTAQAAKPTDNELIVELAKKAKELDLPLGPENFSVIRDEDRHTLKISTAWDTEVHFLWGVCGAPCVKTYHFASSAEGSY